MTSPVPIAPQGGHGGWSAHGQMMPQNNEMDDSGVQVRPMGRMLFHFAGYHRTFTDTSYSQGQLHL